MEKIEVNLYREPVYEVQYEGTYHRETFTLKTLKGAKSKAERLGLTKYKIHKVTRHLYDWVEDKREFIEESN